MESSSSSSSSNQTWAAKGRGSSSKRSRPPTSDGTDMRGGGRRSAGGGGGEYVGMGGIARFPRVDAVGTEMGTGGTIGRVEEGGIGKGRRGRAFENLLRPRGFGCSTDKFDASSAERMIDSRRAGAAMTCIPGEYKEIKSWNWRV
jgi:hypothetical protein